MDVPPDRVMQMVPCPGRGPGPPAQGPGAPGPGPCIIANVLLVLPLFLFLSTMFSALPHSIHMSVRHEPRARAPGPEQRAPARDPGPVPWPRAPARSLGGRLPGKCARLSAMPFSATQRIPLATVTLDQRWKNQGLAQLEVISKQAEVGDPTPPKMS